VRWLIAASIDVGGNIGIGLARDRSTFTPAPVAVPLSATRPNAYPPVA